MDLAQLIPTASIFITLVPVVLTAVVNVMRQLNATERDIVGNLDVKLVVDVFQSITSHRLDPAVNGVAHYTRVISRVVDNAMPID